MPDDKDYGNIKAGVDGLLGDVPSPSSGAPPDSIPSTSYAQSAESENYGSSGGYTQQVEQQQDYGSSGGPMVNQQIDSERMHQIIEMIVSEKWDEFTGKIGNLAVWKEKTNNDVLSIKQELIRLEERFEQLQNAVLGKITQYDEGIKGIHTEMKALEKVFEKILEPLTSNIKELGKITEELKKIKH